MTIKIEDIAFMNLREFSKTRLRNTLESDLTVVVKVGTPAAKAAQLYEKGRPGGVVMVVSPSNKPMGILEPGAFTRSLVDKPAKAGKLAKAGKPVKFTSVVDNYEVLIKGALRTGGAASYLRRPRRTYCVLGKHYGDGNPCSEHSHALP